LKLKKENNMKKSVLIIIFTIIAVAAAVLILRFLAGDEDTWLCQNGEWVKHGNPSAAMPTNSCGDKPAQVFTTIKGNSDIIKITKPLPQAVISSPLEIEGSARGTWYFEASFPIKLLDDKRQEIASGIAQAQSDWMTENFVAFKAKIDFAVAADTNAILVLMKDNPSDLRQYDDQLEIPIYLQGIETMVIKLFFNNSKMDPEFSCNKVFAVEREIPKTTAVARASLEELFKGPTEAEKAAGYFSAIPGGSKLNYLTITNGEAKADFNTTIESGGGSCSMAARTAQIRETIKQFSTVKTVKLSVEGRTEDIFQP